VCAVVERGEVGKDQEGLELILSGLINVVWPAEGTEPASTSTTSAKNASPCRPALGRGTKVVLSQGGTRPPGQHSLAGRMHVA